MSEDKPTTPAEMGRKGGKAKVPKGFAHADPKWLAENAKKSAAKRKANAKKAAAASVAARKKKPKKGGQGKGS